MLVFKRYLKQLSIFNLIFPFHTTWKHKKRAPPFYLKFTNVFWWYREGTLAMIGFKPLLPSKFNRSLFYHVHIGYEELQVIRKKSIPSVKSQENVGKTKSWFDIGNADWRRVIVLCFRRIQFTITINETYSEEIFCEKLHFCVANDKSHDDYNFRTKLI